MSYGTTHQYLYRVLRPSEDPSKGLQAKDLNSDIDVEEHVAYGTYRSSKYISTCANKSSAEGFAYLGIGHGDPKPKRIVTIDVSLLNSVPGVKIIDLTNPVTLSIYCRNNDRAQGFANRRDEVLVEGNIPAYCITNVDELS